MARLMALALAGPALAGTIEIPVEEIEDRIHGGVLGQMLGNLNGLPHEFDYIEDPGNVGCYEPSLPEGARTDDDTDIEWAHLIEMQRLGERRLPPERIAAVWKASINDWIWSANDYARQLMDLGLEPPLTGRGPLNPWAGTNVSSQFVVEMFALGAPALPREAQELALHYASVSIDGEPLQAAQFFAALVSLSFVERDPETLVRRALPACDPNSRSHRIVEDVLRLHTQHPDNWQVTRRAIRDAYTEFDGVRPDINGYALNGAATVAALLYGRGDFERTMVHAFNFGWDADNNAAMCGTILGVWHGREWMDRQGWDIGEAYRNDRREGLPQDETIRGFGERVVWLAGESLRAAGAERDGESWRIPEPRVVNVEPLVDHEQREEELRAEFGPRLEGWLTEGDFVERARAVYLATMLGLDEELRVEHAGAWGWGVQRLERVAPGLVVAMFKSPEPHGDTIRRRARDAGILVPKE